MWGVKETGKCLTWFGRQEKEDYVGKRARPHGMLQIVGAQTSSQIRKIKEL